MLETVSCYLIRELTRLKHPVEHEAEDTSACDAGIRWQVVREVDEGWPNSLDHALQESSSFNGEDGCPHEGNECSNCDRWI